MFHDELNDRKLVVKYSLAEVEDDHLNAEIFWIPRFRNLQHFIQAITLQDAPREDTEEIAIPRRPFLVLEYLPNGNLWEFGERFREAGRAIPNRMLWRICLCRKCAMLRYDIIAC